MKICGAAASAVYVVEQVVASFRLGREFGTIAPFYPHTLGEDMCQ